MAATKKKKLKTIPQLEKALWGIFSLAVRLEAADEHGNCTCVTCGAKNFYHGGSVHAGHFRPRAQKSVKYDFLNVNPQCARCNTYSEGEQYLHGLWIDKAHGEGTAEALTIKGYQPMKDLGIDMRTYLAEKEEECLLILGKYLHFPEWQTNVPVWVLKKIKDGL